MPEHIGVIERSLGDDWNAGIDLSNIDVFASSAVTSATVSASATDGSTPPTLGAVTPASSVCSFRVSGGTKGESLVTITATNAASTPNVIVREFTVKTV